jgi:small-conductance mechanosensitive channel
MLTEPVINLRRSGRRQVEAEVVLDGRADFNRTIEVIKEVFGKEKLVLGKPEPFVIVDRIAPNEIKLKLRFWFDVSKTDYQTIKSSVMEAVKRNLA